MISHFFLGHNPLGFHRVAYTEWGQRTTKAPVICVHGLARNGRDFDVLASHLQNTTQIFCPDIVGRGQSDWLGDRSLYGYPQYINDMTALMARTGREAVDWVGTSMGGIIGMFMASLPKCPIKRLVINDVGPFIPLTALQRIATYIGSPPHFTIKAEGEAYLRKIYAPFGITKDADWRHMATHSLHQTKEGLWTLAYDPAIAAGFTNLTQDVDFWSVYDQIKCPVLVLRGAYSDILPRETAQQMTERGPKAHLVEIANIGHAPALMDDAQINVVRDFLDLP